MLRLIVGCTLCLSALTLNAAESTATDGVLPADKNGRALNLDFETGDLRDWKAEGEAFEGQPIEGDTVIGRHPTDKSEHTGKFWIGGYEKKQDGPRGKLISVPFRVTHPYATFRVGGGSHPLTSVELVRKDTGKVFFQASGEQRENMRLVAVDLTKLQGQEIYIQLIDQQSGGWGHVNFDDFRFHSKKPNVQLRQQDLYEFAGLSPDEAAKAMTVPEGFKVTAFAGEPDVQQPVAMTIDDRGRLWVAEAYSYPIKVSEKDARDRILIFEDADGDGKFDKRTVFAEKLNLVSGIEIGFGGVWVGAAPELLFFPDRNGDDKPDGPPEVLLDGWGYQDTHETLNSFIWGPDGWLYGCHGVFTHSLVGKPGTPKEQRTPINAAIFRLHPITRKFEVFCYGTSNPWGVDFNDYGQSFLTCCVIPHLFQVIQGARYHRQGGQHFQPYTYMDIPTIAKHRHWVGNQWHNPDRAASDEKGGGHAHAGAMIYLGGSWPDKYRNQLFMNNIHGARLNQDLLTRNGSGYVGDAAPDFLLTHDRWSQIIYLRYGPDGQVYMIDWYDANQCHHHDLNGHDRSNGRIFKISYKNEKPAKVDIQKLSDQQLVDLQLNHNDWYVRQARRVLQERFSRNELNLAEVRPQLAKMAFEHADPTRRLRGLWALHVTGGLDEGQLAQGLANDNFWIRAWTIQLALQDFKASPATLSKFAEMARNDESQVVRLYLTSALQRLPLADRWAIAEGLLSHPEDVTDHNLPLMNWYAIEPLAGEKLQPALELAANGKLPLVLALMVRRVGETGTPDSLALLISKLGEAKTREEQLLYLGGIEAALKGRRQVEMPNGWPAVYEKLNASADADVRLRSASLAVTFGDAATVSKLRETLVNTNVSAAEREEILRILLAAKDAGLVPVLRQLLDDAGLRAAAVRGLAQYDDPATSELLLARYAALNPAERRDALNTLASRVPYALALLTAIEKKTIPATDLTADLVQQLRNLKNEDLNGRIAHVWGQVRETPEEKQKQIARYKKLVTGRGNMPDVPHGRAVFSKVCSQCHTLFGTGGKVGPELTGSNRANLDYLLSNVLDPSAVLAKEYTPYVIETTSGRVLTGLIRAQDKNALTLATANETLTVPRAEIDRMEQATVSMMPEDLLKPLSDDDVRSLVAYLSSPAQVPMRANPENAKAFFNGQDLTGWYGNMDLWHVEKGEIVGRTKTGLKHNEFLKSELVADNFRLSMKVKFAPNTENSGVQFRSQAQPNGDMKGYQADIGLTYWGKLYEEHGRAMLWDKPGDPYVKVNDWNEYVIEARGSHIRTFLNGQACVDLDDPKGAKSGIFALQMHSGGPLEVRFKDLKLDIFTD